MTGSVWTCPSFHTPGLQSSPLLGYVAVTAELCNSSTLTDLCKWVSRGTNCLPEITRWYTDSRDSSPSSTPSAAGSEVLWCKKYYKLLSRHCISFFPAYVFLVLSWFPLIYCPLGSLSWVLCVDTVNNFSYIVLLDFMICWLCLILCLLLSAVPVSIKSFPYVYLSKQNVCLTPVCRR